LETNRLARPLSPIAPRRRWSPPAAELAGNVWGAARGTNRERFGSASNLEDRRWHPRMESRYFALSAFAGVIYSDTNHLAESEENQTTVPADDNNVNIQDYRASSEMLVLRKIQEENFLIFIEIQDPTLRKLAQPILHGAARSTAELTVALNLSIREVERLKKCLRRATNEYMKYEQELANKLGEPADIA
jgi:hypothetical protein